MGPHVVVHRVPVARQRFGERRPFTFVAAMDLDTLRRSPNVDRMATVIPIEDLRRSPTAVLFEGGDGLTISIFVTACERGSGPRLHQPAALTVTNGGTVGVRRPQFGRGLQTLMMSRIEMMPSRAPPLTTSR